MSGPPRYILAPYLATPPEVVDRMLDVAGVRETDCVYDLGCGDGRVVIAAARRGARGVGIDIESYWVAESNRNAAAAGVADRVRFAAEDALSVDLVPATVVFLYLVEWSTRLIVPRVAEQVAPGTRVVSLSFALGTNPPAQVVTFPDSAGRERTLHLWVKGNDPSAGGSGGLS